MNRQVSVPDFFGRAAPLFSSASVMMFTGVSDFAACASREICVGVSTSVGVLQHARRRDDVAGRHGHREVVVAVLEIELALPEIRLGVPAAQVVVHADARIPLRELVQRAVAPHAVGAVFRNVEVPRDVEGRRLPGRERRARSTFITVPSTRVFDARLAARRHLVEPIDHVAALEVARAEARVGAGRRTS